VQRSAVKEERVVHVCACREALNEEPPCPTLWAMAMLCAVVYAVVSCWMPEGVCDAAAASRGSSEPAPRRCEAEESVSGRGTKVSAIVIELTLPAGGSRRAPGTPTDLNSPAALRLTAITGSQGGHASRGDR